MEELSMRDSLSKAEIRKDALQDGVTAASHTVGSVTTIITTAVGDVARALGGFATELFEIRDSARRALRDRGGASTRRPVDADAGEDESAVAR
jgi:hypothetical protein